MTANACGGLEGSIPAVRVLIETVSLDTNDTETLARGCSHHDPAFQASLDRRAEFLSRATSAGMSSVSMSI